MKHALAIALASSISLAGCIVEAPSNEKSAAGAASAEATSAGGMAQGAAGSIKLGAQLDGKLEMLGATFAPAHVVPGLGTRVGLYFKVTTPVTENESIFVHVEDADSHVQITNLDHAPSAGRPTSEWKQGESVRDDFTLVLPAGVTSRAVNVYAGMWDPATDKRMTVSNAQQVHTDGNNRILIATVPVTAS